MQTGTLTESLNVRKERLRFHEFSSLQREQTVFHSPRRLLALDFLRDAKLIDNNAESR
jgi:hypothetical protein